MRGLKNIIAVGLGPCTVLVMVTMPKLMHIIAVSLKSRLGVAQACPLTYSGLSGVGDLIVTGTSVHSRNWRLGMLSDVAKNRKMLKPAWGMIIEGISLH